MKQPIEITQDQMREMLDTRPGLSAPSRQIILAGQCVFKDPDGISWKCPYDAATAIEGASHRAGGTAVLTPTTFELNKKDN